VLSARNIARDLLCDWKELTAIAHFKVNANRSNPHFHSRARSWDGLFLVTAVFTPGVVVDGCTGCRVRRLLCLRPSEPSAAAVAEKTKKDGEDVDDAV